MKLVSYWKQWRFSFLKEKKIVEHSGLEPAIFEFQTFRFPNRQAADAMCLV